MGLRMKKPLLTVLLISKAMGSLVFANELCKVIVQPQLPIPQYAIMFIDSAQDAV